MIATDAVDFENIVDEIRSYSSALAEEISHVERGDNLRDTMIDLIYEIEKKDYDYRKCAFYMNPVTANELYDMWDFTYSVEEDVTIHGRPIKTHATIPEGLILFFAPDAISMGGKIYHPEMIAYAD